MRIAIFIDGSNYYYMVKRNLGWNIDLKKFIDYFRMQGEVVDAYYYTAIDRSLSTQNKFLQMLPHMGYSIVSKPLKVIYNNGMPTRKGNLDVEIVLDMFNTIDNYDMAVLFSGDSDFERALLQLKARGKRFTVVSHPAVVSREILEVAGMHFLDITSMESYVRLTSLPRNLAAIADIPDLLKDMSVEEEYPV